MIPRSDKIRVLVTGATGFLGGQLLSAFRAQSNVIAIAACRDPRRLGPHAGIEVRAGDLLDPDYRRRVVKDIDVICHAAAWASLWNHASRERRLFYQPTCDLIDQAIAHGVRRFIQASSVTIAALPRDGGPIDDFAATRHTGFWPHLDCLIDIDRHMRARCGPGTQMICLRLGNFVGPGNRQGLVPALLPRLKTYLVPWLAGGHKRQPLITAGDLGQAFVRAALAEPLNDYESFNICGRDFPRLREVVEFIAQTAQCPRPWYSVPYALGYSFGWLMEKLHPIVPGAAPFLTRSIVHLCENWVCRIDYAHQKLGFRARQDWRVAIRQQLAELDRV